MSIGNYVEFSGLIAIFRNVSQKLSTGCLVAFENSTRVRFKVLFYFDITRIPSGSNYQNIRSNCVMDKPRNFQLPFIEIAVPRSNIHNGVIEGRNV